ncbi:hypothetical protein BH18ACT4_BH18ACT4_13830 [soil metagenome]
MLIPEEFILLATEPRKGRLPLAQRDHIEPGVAGALAAELVLLGRLPAPNDGAS